jgi:hypothetical protein
LQVCPEDASLGPLAEAMSFTIYNLCTAFANDPQLILQLNASCALIHCILARYVSREAIVESCCRGMHALSADCLVNATTFCQLGTVEVLCQAAWQHHDVPESYPNFSFSLIMKLEARSSPS